MNKSLKDKNIMKNLLILLSLFTALNTYADSSWSEGSLDVNDFDYILSEDLGDIPVIVTSSLAGSALVHVNPVSGVISLSTVHCSNLAGRLYKKLNNNRWRQIKKHETRRRIELFSACLVRSPSLPFVMSSDLVGINDIWEASTGFTQGLDGYADVLAGVELEATDQLLAVAAGLEELPIATMLIDGYKKDTGSTESREEVAELILASL